ncbi:unnamed protein product [Adineta ricciae]|uniref:Uncharacterized protein n=1 Tax=Adineta ricciae TaxID=249248 RepID=A0A816A2D0_ADIRI|nr:unnamed protein product [Adineta ricciae]
MVVISVFLLLVISGISGNYLRSEVFVAFRVSFNQPKLCPTVQWNRTATTFMNRIVVQNNGPQIFIDTNNTIYVATDAKKQILIWHENSTDPIIIEEEKWPVISSIFVSNKGDIYISFDSSKIIKWAQSNNNSVDIPDFEDNCVYIFIDVNNYLYCSAIRSHTVMKRSLDDEKMAMVVAGTGNQGSGPGNLFVPRGIFVDTNLDLYVADHFNHRIQRFSFREKNAKTVAGASSSDITIPLNYPESILLDADKYLFIVDRDNHDIVASGPNGFRRLFGRDGYGEESHQFIWSTIFSFDVYGNIFVVDRMNYRPQKFHKQKDSCLDFQMFLFFHLDDVPLLPQALYSSILTENHAMYSRTLFPHPRYHLEVIKVFVNKTDFYILTATSSVDLYGHLYKHHFDRYNPTHNLIAWHGQCCNQDQFRFTVELVVNTTYILVVTTYNPNVTGPFSVTILGSNKVRLECINASSAARSSYSSELTNASQQYHKDCDQNAFFYETLRLTVPTDAFYGLSFRNSPFIQLYVYKSHFDPLNPHDNSISINQLNCTTDNAKIKRTIHLQPNSVYILLVTTLYPTQETQFSIDIYGPTNVTLERIVDNSTYCYVGGSCNTQVKSIGLTLDDILRLQVNRNVTIQDQPLLIKVTAALSVIMFVAGVINSACSILTFQNVKSQTVGCGLYLLASSVTSLVTIILFTVKFWFVVVTQMDLSVRLSVVEGGCKSIETLLKLFFYWDAWLNACVAVERGMSVYKGVSFDKEKSKRFARWSIFILPIVIVGTVIHESIYRKMFKHEVKQRKPYSENYNIDEDIEIGTSTWCVTSYSQWLQGYNTGILFIHLLGPFIANILSSLVIIIRSARRRAEAQKQRSYKDHLREQWNEQKQLVISPIILVVLSTPRLIISLLSGCADVSSHTWLYICGYFVSFTPSILIFVVFVLPSNSYRKTFKESFFQICQRRRRRL